MERIKPTVNKTKTVGFAVEAHPHATSDTESDYDSSRPSSPAMQPISAKLAAFKGAATATITTNALKVSKLEDMFNVKETRKKAVAETKKVDSKADIQVRACEGRVYGKLLAALLLGLLALIGPLSLGRRPTQGHTRVLTSS